MASETLYNLKIIFEKNSKYANIKIYESEDNRIMLTLDTYIQFVSGEDERLYHYNLVNKVCKINSKAKEFLILGGGDGLVARNIYKINPKANITLVDIDKEIIDLFKSNEKLTKLNENSLKYCKIYFEDVITWVKRCKNKFDIIICDLPDGNSDELKKLYTKEFMKDVIKLLKGSIAIQCHYTIDKKMNKIIKDLLGNSEIIKYTMPFLEIGRVVIGNA